MELAKPRIDVGLFTNQLDAQLDFWSSVAGCRLDHVLPVGGGVHQHRHDMNGSVLKLNHSRAPLRVQPESGFVRLEIARPLPEPRRVLDPDGNEVWLVPEDRAAGAGMPFGIRVTVRGPSRERFEQFYGDALGLDQAGDAFRCGDSLIGFEQGGSARSRDARLAATGLQGLGLRYLTIQVFDVAAEHAAILARGGLEGAPPRTLGDVARISFVRDFDGNWLEISQRRSLTGTLD